MLRLLSPLRVLALAVGVCSILGAQTESVLSRYMPPNANVLIGINWKLVRQSQAGAVFREKLAQSGTTIPPIPGLELLNDMDRVLVSGRTPSQETGDAGLLVAVDGRFDLAKIRRMISSYGLKPQLYNSIQVYRPQGKNGNNLAVVLLNAQTILIGDPPSVFASLERNAFSPPAPAPDSLLGRAAEMDASYDIWVLGDGLNTVVGDRMADVLGDADLSDQARGFEAGVLLRNGLAADLTLHLQTEAAASKLAADVAKALTKGVQGKPMEAALMQLTKHFQITPDGPQVKIRLRLTPQELGDDARMLADAARQAPAVSLSRVQPVVSRSQPQVLPAPPEKKVIRIEGLDDGTRVIPYQQQP
jgi:hypothetical protein